jgi:amino acid transporter
MRLPRFTLKQIMVWTLAVYLLVIATLIALMQSIQWLDRGSSRGRYFGTAMTAAWCAGLGTLLLGFVRQHGSRFTLRTLVILVAVIAVYLGVCQAVHPVIPTMLVAAGLSVAMLHEVQRVGTERQVFPNAESRRVRERYLLLAVCATPVTISR